MTRSRPSHARNCPCPRCRNVRSDSLPLRICLAIGAAAFVIGCALSAVAPPETTIPGFGVPADLPR